MKERDQPLPGYKLIQNAESAICCSNHSNEFLKDLYNSSVWKMEVVDVDKIQFICQKCFSERVYQLLPEKTLL
jgi:thymidine kinase